jgi:GntR family transcriptional regulator, transcriptional repressor for pyruvate dehydrogenase complex
MPRSPVAQSAVQRIQAMIREGVFALGARLPSERHLARQLAVSRASLREAVSILETIGLVRVERGRGTFVVSNGETGGAVLPLPLWRFGSRYTLRDVYQLRHLIEGYGARLAAMAAKEEDITTLRRLLETYREATRGFDLVTSSQTDFQLHHRIMMLSKSRILADLHETYRTIFLESQRVPMARHGRIWEPADEHEKLVQAISHHDPDGAEYYMRLHITRAADRVGIALSDTPQIEAEVSLQSSAMPVAATARGA